MAGKGCSTELREWYTILVIQPELKGLAYGDRETGDVGVGDSGVWMREKYHSELVELFKYLKKTVYVTRSSERTVLKELKRPLKKLAKECFRLNITRYFFSLRVVNRWNELSEKVVSAGTVDTSKRWLDEFRTWKKDFLMDYICPLSPRPIRGSPWFGRTRLITRLIDSAFECKYYCRYWQAAKNYCAARYRAYKMFQDKYYPWAVYCEGPPIFIWRGRVNQKWGTVIPVYSWHTLSKRAQNTHKTAKDSTLCIL